MHGIRHACDNKRIFSLFYFLKHVPFRRLFLLPFSRAPKTVARFSVCRIRNTVVIDQNEIAKRCLCSLLIILPHFWPFHSLDGDYHLLTRTRISTFVIILYADRIIGRRWALAKCEMCLFYLGQRHLFDLTIIGEEKQMTLFFSVDDFCFLFSLHQSESTGSFSAPMNSNKKKIDRRGRKSDFELESYYWGASETTHNGLTHNELYFSAEMTCHNWNEINVRIRS